MTLSEIRQSDKDVLTPSDIAPILGCDPYSINLQADADPSALGFPVIRIGRRVKIPRLAFIKFMEGANTSDVV